MKNILLNIFYIDSALATAFCVTIQNTTELKLKLFAMALEKVTVIQQYHERYVYIEKKAMKNK